MHLSSKLLLITSYIAYYIKGNAQIHGKVIKIRNGIAKGVCSYSQRYFKSAKIEPPVRDPALFPESDINKMKCGFLIWDLCEEADKTKSSCLKFKCASSKKGLESGAKKSARIVGGTVTDPHEFPHMVSIRTTRFDSHICGGTIINAITIVTAAHCLTDLIPDEYRVYAGKHNLSTKENSEQSPAIKSITPHEGFVYNELSLNDIALIQLEQPLNWTPEVQPALLPALDFAPKGECIVTGWGKLGIPEIESSPDVPYKVTLPVVPLEECRQALASEVKISNTVMCAGKIGVAGKGSCHGDSGGPLGFLLSNGSFVLGGIVSAGLGCGRPEYPDVYTDVSKYIKWIHDKVQ